MDIRKSIAISLAVLSGSALADTDDGCRDVLTYSARNYSVETADVGAALKVYDQYCENDQARSGMNFNAGLDTVIKAVPVKFSLGSGSTEERTKYFCKTFDSDYKKRESYYRSVSSVVNETTNAWLACKTLAGQGVLFRPKIAQTQIVIEVARTNSSPASVQGITYDTNLLSCTVPDSDGSKKRVTADGNTTKALSDSYWPITCVRKPQVQKNENVYPKVDISIGTTKGAFLLPVDADAIYPYQWSSDLQRQMTNNSEALKALSSRTTEDQAIQVYQCPKGFAPGFVNNGAWGYYGCQGQITTSPTCESIAYPNQQTQNCTPIGALRLYK